MQHTVSISRRDSGITQSLFLLGLPSIEYLTSACFCFLLTVSESVERSEFLESSTKKYGVPLLMSDAFYNLLDSNNRRRCRKLDQLIMLREEDEGLSDPHELLDSGEKMSIVSALPFGINFWPNLC